MLSSQTVFDKKDDSLEKLKEDCVKRVLDIVSTIGSLHKITAYRSAVWESLTGRQMIAVESPKGFPVFVINREEKAEIKEVFQNRYLHCQNVYSFYYSLKKEYQNKEGLKSFFEEFGMRLDSLLKDKLESRGLHRACSILHHLI